MSDWPTARDWSRAGLWVCRASWLDKTRAIRHDAGAGSTRAVVVFSDASTMDLRAVRAPEFMPSEFAALDWIPWVQPDVRLDNEPMETLITSLGTQDDDLRVSVDGVPVFDGRCNVAWYYGETSDPGNASFNPLFATEGFRVVRITRAMTHALGFRILPGAVISVDVFDGWGGTWQTSPWRADITWASGLTTSIEGGWDSEGDSIEPLPDFSWFEINLVEYFPLRTDVGDFARYGARTFGPYPVACSILSHADNPAWFDDDMVLNGSTIYPTGVADLVNGGATTTLLYLPAGNTFSVDVQNSYGWCWAQGALRVVPDASSYYQTGPHFESYIPDGSFTVPVPPG